MTAPSIAGTDPAPSGQIHNLQALRGVAILGVLLFHLHGAEALLGKGLKILPAATWIGLGGVDLFFVISGYVMIATTRNLQRTRPAWFGYLFKRAFRIYPLYWFVTLAYIGAHAVFPGPMNAQRWQDLDWVRSFLLCPQEQHPVLVVGWTLVHELYFYFALGLLLLFPRRRMPVALCVWGALVLLGNRVWGTGLPPPTPWIRLIFHPMTFEFLAGCGLALLLEAGVRACGRTALVVGSALLFGLIWAPPAWIPAITAKGWPRVAALGIPAVLVVYGAIVIEQNRGVRLPRWIQYIGDISYSLYLCHVPVLLGLMYAGSRLLPANGLMGYLLLWISVVAGTLAVAIGCYHGVERPLLQFGRRLQRYF